MSVKLACFVIKMQHVSTRLVHIFVNVMMVSVEMVSKNVEVIHYHSFLVQELYFDCFVEKDT